MSDELTGHSAIVTGGAGGLGAATVRHLVSLGLYVTIFDRNADGARALALAVGEDTVAVGGDVNDDDDVTTAISTAREMGPIALLVNIAGGGVKSQRTVSKDGAPHDKDAFAYTMAINATGTFNVSRLVAAAMGANEPDSDGQRGVIVNTSSLAGLEGQAGQLAYAAAKAAIAGMTLPMARDLAPLGASEEVDFWLWFEAIFEDRAIEAWVWESSDGTVQYVDGGFTFDDNRLSKRFVSFQHDITFDGERKRPRHADIAFVDEDGETFRVTAHAKHQDVNANYGSGLSRRQMGGGMSYYKWNSTDSTDLDEIESNLLAIDQLMEFEFAGLTGHGIFELLVRGDHYERYPNWGQRGAPAT